MTGKRLYLILVGVVSSLLIGLLFGTYKVNSLLTVESNKLTDLKAATAALEMKQLSLNKAKKQIAAYADLEKISQTVVPKDKDQAQTVRQIVNIAAENNIGLSDITFPASTLGSGPVGATTPAAGNTAQSPANNADSATNKLSQLQPVKNIPGVYQLTITITSDPNSPVRYNQFLAFLAGLEKNRRTAQVSNISLQPDSKDQNLLTFSLTVNEYIKP